MGTLSAITQGINIFAQISPIEEKSTFNKSAIKQIIRIKTMVIIILVET